MNCKCLVRDDVNGSRIDFCPLHSAAPDLLAACKAALRLCDANGFSRPGERHHDLLTAAIAKAEKGA